MTAAGTRYATREEFLLARLAHDPTWVGLSSDAMIVAAISGRAPKLTCWPADRSDLERCEETYRRAPADLQQLMLPILEEFRTWISEGIRPRPTVKHYCLRCSPNRQLHPDAFNVVSPNGVAHRGGMDGETECGSDATGDGWWWEC